MIRRSVGAMILALGLAQCGLAQFTGGSSGGNTGGGTSSSTSGRTGGSTGSSTGGFNNISNSFNPAGSAGTMLGATSGGTGATGGATGGRGGSSGTSFSISTTNFLQPHYANPLYPGRPNSTNLNAVSGNTGFGQPSFGAVQTTSGGTRATGTGGSASISRGGNNQSTTQQQQQSISRVHYTTEFKFAVPTVDVTQFQTELQNVVARSSSIKNPAGIAVGVEPGGLVVLRGRAAGDDERRLVEAMIRLSPGVKQIRNELAVP